MLSLYDLPTWLLALVIIGGCLALGWLGMIPARFVLTRLGAGRHLDSSATTFQVVGGLYGILLALLAVNVSANFDQVDSLAVREATTLESIYVYAQRLPPPGGAEINLAIREYVQSVVSEEWPAMRRGEASPGTGELADRVTAAVLDYQPSTQREFAIHSSAIELLREFVETRSDRLGSNESGINPIIWSVVIIGGIVTLITAYFVGLADWRIQAILVGAIGALVGVTIFLIVAMDFPLRGELSVGPEPFLEFLRERGAR